MLPLRMSDLRQWAFCNRVLWHRYMMPHPYRETPKMALGRRAEIALDELEKRRTAREYGLHGATRRFDVAVSSVRLGLSGVCDLVLDVPARTTHWPSFGKERVPAGLRPVELTAARRLFPVDIKRTEGGVGRHHALQLAGYALALEEMERLPDGSIDRGFILLLPSDEVATVRLDRPLRDAVVRALGEIRTMLLEERFPPPTRHRSFCPQCEHVNFCGDVL